MVLTVSFVLSRATGLVCHPRLADTSAKLDASVGASGPHDFAVRRPRFRQRRRLRPSHPVPTSVTIAKRPSVGRDSESINLFLPNGEIKYFCGRDWTAKPENSLSGKSPLRPCLNRRVLVDFARRESPLATPFGLNVTWARSETCQIRK
jgi:hypothetical protein